MQIDGNWVRLFLGDCVGIGLSERSPGDKHVCFTILHEDDEHWFPSESSLSTSWFADFTNILAEARAWVESNCDPDLYNGRQYGWKFR